MNLIVPGLKEINREWMNKLAAHLRLECECIHYPWWDNSDSEISPNSVVSEIKKMEPEIIIAKSIGTLFTAMALSNGLALPKALVFLGIPKNAISEPEFSLINHAVNNVECPVLIIQQSLDFLGSYAEVNSSITKCTAQMVEIPGNDHLYDNFDLIAKIIDDWIESLETNA